MSGPALRRRLLRWYRAERRDLPWRRTRDPYAIWISEAMLQQTRVETVEPYWHRFLARFPDVGALAAATEDEVLAQWSGLGYYRRARSLHAAAREIVEHHGGRFPERREDALALPGVGAYTAGAVLSIAFDRPEPAVDGNVARVLGRLFALDLPPGAGLQRELEARARELVPKRGGAGDWTQALMELGARVCTPREPDCPACPVATECAALAQESVARLPRPKPRRAPVEVELEIALARRGEAVLLQRRPAQGRMAGMWQFPTIELARQPRLFPAAPPPGVRFLPGEALATLRHTITHHRIRAAVRAAEHAPHPVLETVFENSAENACDAALAWIEPAGLADLALTGMTRKVLSRSLASPGSR